MFIYSSLTYTSVVVIQRVVSLVKAFPYSQLRVEPVCVHFLVHISSTIMTSRLYSNYVLAPVTTAMSK